MGIILIQSFCYMNFSNLMQESLSNDYNRLIELCSSYGLNEQQTNQIISDFKNGSFAQQDQSIDESFQQSLRELDSNLGEEHTTSHHEEYSFKHQKNGAPNPHNNTNTHNLSLIKDVRKDDNFQHLISNHDSFQHEPNSYGRPFGNQEFIQFFISQRKDFQKNIQSKLQQQNERLKESLRQKEQTIGALLKMKTQDSQIILGLKQSLLNLTNMIQEKDQSYRYLVQKYEKLKNQSEGISTQKTSKVQLSQQQSLSSFEQRKSVMKQRQHCITETEASRVVKKPSQKYIKQVSGRNNSKVLERSNIENRQNMNKNESKRSGIDISKYKGMIDKLRSSYQFR